MKQIIQSPRTGKLELAEVPAPALAPGFVLVHNHFSVVSPGTEKQAMDFARKSMLGKARSRPDLVKQVTRKLVQEGPLPTYRASPHAWMHPNPLVIRARASSQLSGTELRTSQPEIASRARERAMRTTRRSSASRRISLRACPMALRWTRPPSRLSAQSRCRAYGSPNRLSAKSPR